MLTVPQICAEQSRDSASKRVSRHHDVVFGVLCTGQKDVLVDIAILQLLVGVQKATVRLAIIAKLAFDPRKSDIRHPVLEVDAPPNGDNNEFCCMVDGDERNNATNIGTVGRFSISRGPDNPWTSVKSKHGWHLLVRVIDGRVVTCGCWTDIILAIHVGAHGAYRAVASASILRKQLESVQLVLGHRDGFQVCQLSASTIQD